MKFEAPPAAGLAEEDPLSAEGPPPAVDIRSVSLAVLAVLATLFALRWAATVVIPLLLGLMFSYALSPVVDRLERMRMPRAVGAALLLLAILGAMGWTGYSLKDDAASLIASLPDSMQKVRQTMREKRGQAETPIDKVQKAANELEQAAQEGSQAGPPQPRGVQRVRIERPQFDIKDYLWSGTLGLVTGIGQAVVVLFITFFLLASGSSFRRKMVHLAGPDFAQKRLTVQALDEITEQIQRYLLVQVFTSIGVGLVTWAAFAWIGMNQAAVWGVAACVLNFIPYVGSVVLMGGSALMAFVQFGSLNMALLVAGVSLLVHMITGNLLTPWLTSRTNRINTLAVFVGVLAFGWLWGLWGLLLGVPVLTTVKAVCDRVDNLKPIGEMLGT